MGAACPLCGSTPGWFTIPRAQLTPAGLLLATPDPIQCLDCGGSFNCDLATDSDSRSAVRARAQQVAAATPGTWVVWQTYSRERVAAARVAASELRTGKVKSVASAVGAVDARVARRSDGTLLVEVSRRN